MDDVYTSSEFYTKDIYLAAVLIACGNPCLRTEFLPNQTRQIFIFEDTEQLQAGIDGYFSGVMASPPQPQNLFAAFKLLRTRVEEARDQLAISEGTGLF